MINLSIALLLSLFLSGLASAQTPAAVLKQVRQIKLLDTSRGDVRKLMHEYVLESEDDESDRYSNFGADIKVYFSSGSCADDPEEDDPSQIWKVQAGNATRIELSFEDEISVKDLGLDFTKLMKEQRYNYSENLLIYHDKRSGVAVEIGGEEVHNIFLFPGMPAAKSLCKESVTAKQFYERESWYSEKLENRDGDCINQFANVVDVELSSNEIEVTLTRTVSVNTVATDPENDVLTYNYTVTAGRIIGQGAKVVWDLTGVNAGTYTITAGVDDGAGVIGTTVIKTVTVK